MKKSAEADTRSFLDPIAAIRSAHIRDGAIVADFGSGSGFFARAAARAVGPRGRVWAIDVHRDMLARLKSIGAAEGLRNIDIVAGDCEARGGSQLADDSMDMVIAANILFSATDRDALVEEIWRVLRSGKGGRKQGRALVIDWKRAFSFGPEKRHMISEDEARALFERGGFQFVESVPGGAYHWGFVVQKV